MARKKARLPKPETTAEHPPAEEDAITETPATTPEENPGVPSDITENEPEPVAEINSPETESTGESDDQTPEPPAEDEETESNDEEKSEEEKKNEEAETNAEDGDEDENEGEDEEGEGEEGEDESSGQALPLPAIVEAVLFAAREPLKIAQIARAVGKRTRHDAVRAAMDELNVQYLETGRAFEIAEISGKHQLMSRPEFADHIMRIYPKRELTPEKDKIQRLTPAMLDTLAIIAYKQPVMRSEIDHIRGASCANHLRSLIERGTVKAVGRRTDLVGKPAVYGTTERFLAEFGLGSIEELPMRNEFIDPGAGPQLELIVPIEDEEPENEETESAAAVPEESDETVPVLKLISESETEESDEDEEPESDPTEDEDESEDENEAPDEDEDEDESEEDEEPEEEDEDEDEDENEAPDEDENEEDDEPEEEDEDEDDNEEDDEEDEEDDEEEEE